jgi:hypothetical protein
MTGCFTWFCASQQFNFKGEFKSVKQFLRIASKILKGWKHIVKATVPSNELQNGKSKTGGDISLAWQTGVYAKPQLYRFALLSYRKLFKYVS